jgi:hypothetical protein
LCAGRFRDADLAPLAALFDLEKLSLSENDKINGTFCVHLAGLRRLRELSPGEHISDDGLACIARIANLETLFLKGPFSDAGLGQIRSLKRLQTLYVTSERVTPEGLAVVAELPELTDLGLRVTPVTDASVPILARCKALASLTLFHSDLTYEGRKLLREALLDCDLDEH